MRLVKRTVWGESLERQFYQVCVFFDRCWGSDEARSTRCTESRRRQVSPGDFKNRVRPLIVSNLAIKSLQLRETVEGKLLSTTGKALQVRANGSHNP
jgi:hypothetical protein